MKIVRKDRAHELSLADHTGAIKCVAYDNICEQFQSGDVITMRQFERGYSGILLANKNTRVYPCPPLKNTISDDIMATAQILVDPPVPPVASISSILQNEKEALEGIPVTIEGRITHVSTTHDV